MTAELLCLLLLKLLIGSGGYSGFAVPPKYGDFEAHRHWMEITTNLPLSKWYSNSSNNNLDYWPIDYPPLSAYHSYLMGKIAGKINPNWTALYTSRGFESVELKMFMRYSVIFVDFLIFVSAVYYYSLRNDVSLLVALMYPGLMLVDHGHFQYNCVALGFVVWAVGLLKEGRVYLASIFYVLAVFYKQTSLYFLMVISFKIMTIAFDGGFSKGFNNIFKIGLCCFVTTSAILSPFIIANPSPDSLLDIYIRTFPFWRGLYEDKVANFWCSISVLVKIDKFPHVISLCTWFTLVFSCLPLYLHFKNKKFFVETLTASSLAFYLFSFHVHEKSIIFPAVAMSLSNCDHWLVLWFLEISTISLFPLMRKDGQTLQIIVLLLLFHVLSSREGKREGLVYKLYKFAVMGAVLLVLCDLFGLPVPVRYPHLWTRLLYLYCCANFMGIYSALLALGRSELSN